MANPKTNSKLDGLFGMIPKKWAGSKSKSKATAKPKARFKRGK